MGLEDRTEIARYLADRGYSEEHVEKILQRLDQFDERITRESLFDGTSSGNFDIDAIIKEALREE